MEMKFRRRTTSLASALVVALALSLAACSPSGPSNKHFDDVTIALADKLPSIETGQLNSRDQGLVLGPVYATLTSLDKNGSAVPELAKSWTVSDDGLQARFVLRGGLVFSDDTPLTAADVVASINLARKSDSFIYAQAFASVVSTEAESATTVLFKLSSPLPDLPMLLADAALGVFPASRVSEKGFFDKPISAGRYVLEKSAKDGSSFSMTANPLYWGGATAPKRLKFVTIEDASSRLSQLRAGTIDMADALVPATLDQKFADVKIKYVPAFGGIKITGNTKKGLTADVRIRQAISAAINRRAIATTAVPGAGLAAAGYFPPTSQYYLANLADANPKAAKDLLKGTSCASGCKIEVLVDGTDETGRTIALMAKEQLAKIGIDLTISQVDFGVLVDRLLNNDHDLVIVSTFSFSDDATILPALELSAGLGTGFVPDESTGGLIQNVITSTGQKRADAADALSKAFATQLPFIPVMSEGYITGSRTGLPLSISKAQLLHFNEEGAN